VSCLGASLLRICTASFAEVSKVRKDLDKVLEIIQSSSSSNKEVVAKNLFYNACANSNLADDRQTLSSACAVEDCFLRECFLEALEAGGFGLELATLRELLASQQNSDELLLQEVRLDNLNAVVIKNGKLLENREEALEVIMKEMEAPASVEPETLRPFFLFIPVFTYPTWRLVELLLRRCWEERVLPTVDLLFEAVNVLTKGHKSAQATAEITLLRLINDAPEMWHASLAITTCGQVFVSTSSIPYSKVSPEPQASDAVRQPFPLYSEGSEVNNWSNLGTDDAQRLTLARACMSSHQGTVRDFYVASSRCCSRLLMVVELMQRTRAVRAFGLTPQGLLGTGPGNAGALLWACSSLLTISQASSHQSAGLARQRELDGMKQQGDMSQPSDELCLGTQGNDLAAKAQQIDNQPYEIACGLEMHRATNMTSEHCQINMDDLEQVCLSKSSPGSMNVMSLGKAREEVKHELSADVPQDEDLNAVELAPSESSGDETDDKLQVRLLFSECFKEDLLQPRQILMSQVNNLYKLRNGGQPLEYKKAGYEKLHDFLLDIPGLSLQGSGNRMHVRVIEHRLFEEFCKHKSANLEFPSFQKPKPVPLSSNRKFWRCLGITVAQRFWRIHFGSSGTRCFHMITFTAMTTGTEM